MLRKIPGLLTIYEIVPLFLGGWLTLICQSTPVQAQINNNKLTTNGVLLAQVRVFEALPPPPNLSPIPENQQPLIIPQVQQPQPLMWNSSNPNVQPYQAVRRNLYNQQQYERYLVYVDNNLQQLQKVRQIEPRAYLRQYNGRYVIQSGAFSRESNALQRVRELELNGIRGAQVIRATNGEEIVKANNPIVYNPRAIEPQRSNSRFYYVAIPAQSEQLNAIANQIRQNTGRYDILVERQQPIGPHVAVGPFTQRSDAEQWNSYLLKLGFGNARVYYGH